jgi:hypothetical protein
VNSANANPYAPPQAEVSWEIPAPLVETLDTDGPISFAGAVDEAHLHEFLKSDGHVGCAQMLLGLISLSLILLVLAFLGGGFTAIAIGCLGVIVVTLTVSTIPYRRLVFQNINPDWNRPRRGLMRADGVVVRRDETALFLRWDWFDGAVIGDRFVAFLPATQRAAPLLVTRSMLVNLDDWNRLTQVAGAISVDSERFSKGDQRRGQNQRILRDRSRARTVDVPTEAIPFQGTLTAAELARVPGRYRRRQRPLRTYVVNTVLVTHVGLVLAGLSQLFLEQALALPIVVLFYVVVTAVLGRWRGRDGRVIVNYLNAFATESSVVSDFAVTTAEVSWSALQPVLRTDDVVVLQRRQWIQFIVARRNMFASDEAWQRFNGWVDRAEEGYAG